MFKNREEAGRLLAQKFSDKILSYKNVVIVALPRGGVPVAYEVAEKLKLPLDIFSVKKIGAPMNPELALGAITEEGGAFLNESIIKQYNINRDELKKLSDDSHSKAQAQARKLRGDKSPISLKNKSVILIDDGIATGATVKAAIELIKRHGAIHIILATPVCSEETIKSIKELVDETLVLDTPTFLMSVGQYYRNFSQVTDDEAASLLQKSDSADKQSTTFINP